MKNTTVKYLSTGKMAKMLDFNVKFLVYNRNKIFKEGTHYFRPLGENNIRWSIEEMINWVENKKNCTIVEDVMKRIVG